MFLYNSNCNLTRNKCISCNSNSGWKLITNLNHNALGTRHENYQHEVPRCTHYQLTTELFTSVLYWSTRRIKHSRHDIRLTDDNDYTGLVGRRPVTSMCDKKDSKNGNDYVLITNGYVLITMKSLITTETRPEIINETSSFSTIRHSVSAVCLRLLRTVVSSNIFGHVGTVTLDLLTL